MIPRIPFLTPLLLWTFVLGGTISSVAKAKGPVNSDPLKASALVIPAEISKGDQAELRVQLHLDPDHHAYVDQFKLIIDRPIPLPVGKFSLSPLVKFNDKFSKRIREGIVGDAVLKAAIEIPNKAPSGPLRGQIDLTYQACSTDYCLLPKTIHVEFDLKVKGDEKVPQKMPWPLSFSEAQSQGTWTLFVMVFLAGILTSFTPCIFPMIPITLAILGARHPRKSRSRGFFISLVYVLGIALTYSLLGVLAASTGSMFGQLLGSPTAVMTISAIFFFMALSLYGIFEIQAPESFRALLGKPLGSGEYVKALLSGLLAGLVASPCVGPMLIGILAYVAQSQKIGLGFWLLFTYAMGMGLLFLILGTFSQLIHRLPRSGSWLETTKFVSGSLMVAAAFYFLKPVVSKEIWLTTLGFAIAIVSYLHGAFDSKKLKGLRQLALSGFVLGVLLFVSPLIIHHTDKAPSRDWQDFQEVALERAISHSQPVIVDFFADWCEACKELESTTFRDPQFLALTKDFLRLRYDATQTSPEFEELRKKYQILGLPFVILYDRHGKWRPELTLTGYESAAEFSKRIEKLDSP